MNKEIINKLKQLNLNKRRFKKYISKFCNVSLRYWVVKFIYTKKEIYHVHQIKEALSRFFNARGINE